MGSLARIVLPGRPDAARWCQLLDAAKSSQMPQMITCGTVQEYASSDSEQMGQYYSDRAWGTCEMSSSETDLDYLSHLDLGWMPWRMNSYEKMMKAGGSTPGS